MHWSDGNYSTQESRAELPIILSLTALPKRLLKDLLQQEQNNLQNLVLKEISIYVGNLNKINKLVKT